jgi:ribosomal protein S18 acetylase RimI-like enzyme
LTFQPGPFPHFANVSAVRVRDDTLDLLLSEVVDWFAMHGRSGCTWFLGPSTTPSNVVEWLLARGSASSERATAMWLDAEPAPTSAVQVRPVNSPEELLVYREMTALASGTVVLTDDGKAAIAASNPQAWADLVAMEGRRRNYLALIDDQPVAAAGLLLTDRGVAVMAGGATLPQARGRGCYRALVRARWDDAVAAGSPNLVAQASDMSGPILAAMGFRGVAELTIVQQTFPI